MVAVGPPSEDVKSEVDFRWCCDSHDATAKVRPASGHQNTKGSGVVMPADAQQHECLLGRFCAGPEASGRVNTAGRASVKRRRRDGEVLY